MVSLPDLFAEGVETLADNGAMGADGYGCVDSQPSLLAIIIKKFRNSSWVFRRPEGGNVNPGGLRLLAPFTTPTSGVVEVVV